jgi:hypothetical protein
VNADCHQIDLEAARATTTTTTRRGGPRTRRIVAQCPADPCAQLCIVAVLVDADAGVWAACRAQDLQDDGDVGAYFRMPPCRTPVARQPRDRVEAVGPPSLAPSVLLPFSTRQRLLPLLEVL